MSDQRRLRTSLDSDGVAKVGAEQLPGDAQPALCYGDAELMTGGAIAHHNLLIVQGHCKDTLSFSACPSYLERGLDNPCVSPASQWYQTLESSLCVDVLMHSSALCCLLG